MALSQLNFAGLNKVEVAIMRLKEFEPKEGYYLAFSGGKDSQCIYHLALEAGVKFDAHYHRTGIDPPELVQFIKYSYPNIIWDKPSCNIFKLIEKRGLPIRVNRWCCDELKEGNGSGRRIITGIRWQESSRRANRRMFEACKRDSTRYFLNVIIDWTETEVWEYIHMKNIPYCSLYDEGFKRLGCVLCPMTTYKKAILEYNRWPKLGEAWKRAAERLYNRRVKENNDSVKRWATFEDMWQWWLSRKGEPKVNNAQCIMFDN